MKLPGRLPCSASWTCAGACCTPSEAGIWRQRTCAATSGCSYGKRRGTTVAITDRLTLIKGFIKVLVTTKLHLVAGFITTRIHCGYKQSNNAIAITLTPNLGWLLLFGQSCRHYCLQSREEKIYQKEKKKDKHKEGKCGRERGRGEKD